MSIAVRVHLFLRVKVAPKWLDDRARYREMGLESPGAFPPSGGGVTSRGDMQGNLERRARKPEAWEA